MLSEFVNKTNYLEVQDPSVIDRTNCNNRILLIKLHWRNIIKLNFIASTKHESPTSFIRVLCTSLLLTTFTHVLYSSPSLSTYTHFLYWPPFLSFFIHLLYSSALLTSFTHLLYSPLLLTSYTHLFYSPPLLTSFTHCRCSSPLLTCALFIHPKWLTHCQVYFLNLISGQQNPRFSSNSDMSAIFLSMY